MILEYTCQESIVLEKALAYWLDGYSENAPGRPLTQAFLERAQAINRAAGAPTCEQCESCKLVAAIQCA